MFEAKINPIIAHQGGWDEILMVVGPLAAVAGLLWLATKRLNKKLATKENTEKP